MNLVHKLIDAIADDPYAYVILNGDLLNNATRNSVSDIYTERMSPMEQAKKCVELLTPIKEKILAATSGNHCQRSYKTEGLDIMSFVFAELGIADKYDLDGVMVYLRMGTDPKAGKKQTGDARQLHYTIYCSHGAGGGRTAGAKANALSRRSESVHADICVVGHTHMPMTFREGGLYADKTTSKTKMKETVNVNTASTLGWGGYSERLGLKPSSHVNPVIVLDGTRFNIEVRI